MNKEELKSLDEALDYLNEGKLLDKLKAKFKLGKKPDKKAPIKNIENKSKEPLTKEEIKQAKDDYAKLVSELKKAYTKIKNTPEFKSACKDSVNYLRKLDWDDGCKDNFIPDIEISDFESGMNRDNTCFDGIIEVIADTQENAIAFAWIEESLVDYIKENNPELHKKFSYSYGDGDEGCIYVIYK